MPLTPEKISTLVSSPSVGAIAYQAQRVVKELRRVNEEEFPQQTCSLRDVFLCLADYTLEQLWDLYDPANALEPRGGPAGVARLHSLGKVTHELYSYIRYLLASSPRQAPPALQLTLTELTKLYFPRTPREPEALCLVRPQWKYNLKYVQLTRQLRSIVSPSVFDPDWILKTFWKRHQTQTTNVKTGRMQGDKPPKHIAVLSFAGLDTNDTLCYPLLAHELGHFIDYSCKPHLHLDKRLKKTAVIRYRDVQSILKKYSSSIKEPDSAEINYWKKLVVILTYSCLRELLADLLATRMMGFAFFAAQSEFLKTLLSWTEPRVTQSGYPGFQFRLWSALRHLLRMTGAKNPLEFFKKHSKSNRDARLLVHYLEQWSERLAIDHDDPPGGTQGSGSTPHNEMYILAERAVIRSLDVLNQIAIDIIPDANCPPLTARFLERITELKHELPPSNLNEGKYAFSEIMSAAWAYQVIYGEEREAKVTENNDRFEEYDKTCRLTLKAIELIPVSRAEEMPISNPRLTSRQRRSKAWLRKGVLSASHIRQRIALKITDPAHLAIMPLKDFAIKGASIDVHLGNRFAFARRTKLSKVKLTDPDQERLLTTVGRDEVYIPSDRTFLLHPGDLVLGVTREFFGLPNDLMAFVEGRSGLGRHGLFVATATQVAPGYHGVIVLELANAGTVPFELEPGMAIAQLVLQVMTDKTTAYRGKYHCQIKP